MSDILLIFFIEGIMIDREENSIVFLESKSSSSELFILVEFMQTVLPVCAAKESDPLFQEIWHGSNRNQR